MILSSVLEELNVSSNLISDKKRYSSSVARLQQSDRLERKKNISFFFFCSCCR